MRYLKSYKIFESKKSLTDNYLSKMGTTRQDVTDIFQGVVDLGYEPKFKVSFLDKNGNSRDEKLTAHETPLLTIKFSSSKEKYIGGSVRFDNLDYLENLYHSLSMFMSMFKDKCNIDYEIDNMVELCIRCQFDTEYDESKVALTKDDLYDALQECKLLVTDDYEVEIDKDYRSFLLYINPTDSLARKLYSELKSSKDDKFKSNEEEVEKFNKDIISEMAKKISKLLNKDIRYVDVRGSSYFDDKGSGLYLFNNGKESQLVVRINDDVENTKNYKEKIKRGLFKTDNVMIELYKSEITFKLP